MMKKLQTFKPKCIICNKTGGTIFSKKDGYYKATCGSPQPCKLDIKLFRGWFENKGMMVRIYKEEIEKHKDNIIKQGPRCISISRTFFIAVLYSPWAPRGLSWY